MSLRQEVRTVALTPVAALVATFLVVLAVEAWRVGSEVDRAVGGLARGQLERVVGDFRLTCETAHAELDRRLTASLAVAEDALARAGGFGLADVPVSWRATSQLDGAVREVTLRRATLGAQPIERNVDFSRATPLVDDVTRLTGAAATVFQRMDEAGDMLRIATSVKAKGGGRAVGTYIPATGPDGPSPVVAAVLRGERYQGRAFVVDAWYITVYEPLRGRDGRVEGMLFVGVRQDGLESLKHAAGALRVGESGQLLVVGGKGSQRGKLLMSSGAFQLGEDLSALVDPQSGRHFVQEALERAPGLPSGEIAHDRWLRPAAGGAEARPRLAAYAYFAPWDWLLVSAMDEGEATAAARSVRGLLWRVAAALLVLASGALAGAAVYARRAAARIAGPVEAMAGAAEGLARGDLEQVVAHRGQDEVGRMAEALRSTVAYVRDVAAGAQALAEGDLTVKLTPRSEADHLSRRFLAAQRSLRELIAETERLTRAATEGELAVRADPGKVHGAYAEVLLGMNHTLDALCAPVEDATAVLARLGAHDLTARVTTSYRGDHARLKEALDATGDALSAALAQAASVSRQVAAASEQIATASQQAAAGAQSQASVLEETGAALETVSELTQRTAGSAQQATALAAEARAAAEQGHLAVEAMDAAVAGIRGSAESTSQIIKDVSEIALQTNLLALNAAVEAARAGEAGRGFAVVAEEVRSLALRAREAAGKTESLIQQSVAQAAAGEAQARQVAGRLSEIVAAVNKVSTIVAEIADAAREQSSGIEGVHRAIAGVSELTQQHASGSDESSAAAQALSQQAAELAALIGEFRLEAALETTLEKAPEAQAPAAAGPPLLLTRALPSAPIPDASDRRSPRC